MRKAHRLSTITRMLDREKSRSFELAYNKGEREREKARTTAENRVPGVSLINLRLEQRRPSEGTFALSWSASWKRIKTKCLVFYGGVRRHTTSISILSTYRLCHWPKLVLSISSLPAWPPCRPLQESALRLLAVSNPEGTHVLIYSSSIKEMYMNIYIFVLFYTFVLSLTSSCFLVGVFTGARAWFTVFVGELPC